MAVEAGGTSWPRDQLQAALRDEVAGLEVIRMLIAHPQWVHRRIDAPGVPRRHHLPPPPERALHRADGRARDPGGGRRFRLVPLATLRKETLVNFDCRDESGTALPVLTRTQQGLLTVRGLTAWAEALVDQAAAEPLDADVAAEVATLVAGEAGERAARSSFAGGGAQRAALRDDEFFSLVLERLTEQFLITLVGDVPGTQRVLKFSYEELGRLAAEPWPRAPLAALGWIPRRAASAAESLFSAESYHFEADLPPGIDVPVASLWVGSGEDDMACIDVDPGNQQRIALRSPATRGRGRGAVVGVAGAAAGCARRGSAPCWPP